MSLYAFDLQLLKRMETREGWKLLGYAIMVDFRINETLPMHSQPPKSPLSGGLMNQLRKS